MKVRSGPQSLLQRRDRHSKPIPCDLHDSLKGAFVQANSSQRSGKALIANDASFGRFSIFHHDYKRNQTSIREICKFQLSTGVVKD